MTTGTNDRDLHDPALDAAWRAHSREEPPARLDAAILAAAHRASGAAPRDVVAEARAPWQWWWPLAAAATIGAVAIGVIQLLPADKDAASTVVSDAPRTTLATREHPAPEPEQAARAKEADAGSGSPVAVAEAPARAPQQERPSSIAAATRSPTAGARKQAAAPSAPAAALTPPPPVRDELADAKQSPEFAAGRVAANELAAKTPAEPEAPAPSAAIAAKDTPDPFPGKKAAQSEKPAAAPSSLDEERKTERQSGLARNESAPSDDRRARRADAAPPATAPAGMGAAATAPPPAASAPPRASFAAPRAAPALRDQGAARESVAQAAPAPAAGSLVAPLAKQKSADEWIAAIRRLHAEGRFDEAAKELVAFRAAHADADARMPPDLRSWAASIR